MAANSLTSRRWTSSLSLTPAADAAWSRRSRRPRSRMLAMTLKPLFANSMAVSKPMPLEEPVTRATLSGIGQNWCQNIAGVLPRRRSRAGREGEEDNHDALKEVAHCLFSLASYARNVCAGRQPGAGRIDCADGAVDGGALNVLAVRPYRVAHDGWPERVIAFRVAYAWGRLYSVTLIGCRVLSL